MFYYYNPLLTASGDILPDYLVRLLDSSGNEVDIFADDSGTPIVTASGVANAAKADALGMVRFWVPNGTYDITIYDTTDTFKGSEVGVPMYDAGTLTTDLSASTGAGLVGSTGGITVQASLNARPTSAALAASGGAAMVGFVQQGTDATADTLAGWVLQNAISIFDFMTDAERADVRARTKLLDVTDAVNNCFAAATTLQRTVFAPDGDYRVGNLLFGSQSTSGQSASPLGLFGESREGARFYANPGLTGTLLQGWSLAGITMRDFTIDTSGTAAQAMDLEWKPFAGPSTQNVIENIVVTGGTATTHVNLKNLNDTIPYRLTVRVNDNTGATCGINFEGSGGLQVLRDCIWTGCYLRWGCQNGLIEGCWGFGIEFAAGSLNYTSIVGSYLYANLTNDAVLWSEDFTTQQSARAVICTATQLITANPDSGDMSWEPVAAYVNMNLYSALIFDACQFIGETGEADINLLGTDSVKDTVANVQVMFRGGSENNLILNDVTGFEYAEPEAFIDDLSGLRVTKNPIYNTTVTLTGIAAATANNVKIYRDGNTVRFDATVSWTGQSPSAPLQFTLPIANAGNNASCSIGYNGDSFSGSPLPSAIVAAGTGIIVFYNAINGAAITANAAGSINISGSFPISS